MPDTAMDSATAVREGSEQDRTLVIERVFKAPPERVFSAWTDPAILVKWWGPEGFGMPDAKLDVRVGGAWRSTMVGPEGEAHIVSGVYREIAPPKRLVMTWGWETNGERGHETVVDLTFEAVAGGTKMRLVQSLFDSVEQRDSHNWGWSSSFNDLDRALAQAASDVHARRIWPHRCREGLTDDAKADQDRARLSCDRQTHRRTGGAARRGDQ